MVTSAAGYLGTCQHREVGQGDREDQMSDPYRYVVLVTTDQYGNRRLAAPHVVRADAGVTYCGRDLDPFEPLEGFVNFGMA